MEDIPLISYVSQGGGRSSDPINRVSPCLVANLAKLASVRMCCQGLSTDEGSCFGTNALIGVTSILDDIMDEIDEATEVLDESLPRQARITGTRVDGTYQPDGRCDTP